jgi:hypothetical protein
MVQEFFTQNKDLLPVRRYVAMEFQQVLGQNPTMSYPKALEETAKIVRKSLGKNSAPPKSNKQKKISLPDGSRSRQQAKQPKGLAKEIEDMARLR